MMKRLVSTTLIAGLATVAFAADAATIRVQCEQRGVQRARVSVDGNNLAPLQRGQMYRAQVISGANTATSPGALAVGDEVEFDFDSNPRDVAEGATAIPSTFATSGIVVGKILAPDGSTVIADTVACRVRSR